MITLGIDLSSQPKNTVACLIDWSKGAAVAREPALRCTDAKLVELIHEADVVGIDAPFGWPADFVAAVAGWKHEEWTNEHRDRLRFRETDRAIKQRLGIDPLSVSTDRIALPAMRAMSLLQRFGVTDRSGDGRFFEVYPAATLVAWGLSRRGYKQTESKDARWAILKTLREKFSFLTVEESYIESSDTLDAFIASLTARAAAQGLTQVPAPEQRVLAQQEGWIHVPSPITRAPAGLKGRQPCRSRAKAKGAR
jgi:predicted nuclease with RNAse H fold